MRKYVLPAVILLAFLLRFVGLDRIPVGFTPDEASFGYDAYSISETGKDQWGKSYPLVFESFGDYKSPLYAYLSIPFVKMFGLSKFSVRLPNALLGTFAVYVTYLLVTELINGNNSFVKKKRKGKNLALMAAFLLSVSPWHIMMSRGAFEANITTLLLPISLYYFIRGLRNPKYYIWVAVSVGLNAFSYHSAKLVTSLLFILLFILFRKEILRNFGIFHKISTAILVFFMVVFLFALKGGSSTRMYDVSIFKTSLLEASSERLKAINQGLNPVIARIVYNKYQAGARHFFGNYSTYFSPQFFFSQGPGESTYGMIPGRGVLYWFELPLLLIGLIEFSKNIKNRYFLIILLWFLLAPIPAALSIGPGYAANRSVITIPAIQIICAFELFWMYERVSRFKFQKILIPLSGLTFLLFFLYFLSDYFILSPQKSSVGMLYGNYEALKYVSENYPGREVVVSRKLSEPHIYTAFVNKWDPVSYQNNSKLWKYKDQGLGWVDQMPEYELGNYLFKNINYNEYLNKNVVLVGRPDEFPESIEADKEFTTADGRVLVKVIDTNSRIYAQKY